MKTRLLMFFAPFVAMAMLNPLLAAASQPSAVTVLPAKEDISAKQEDKIRQSLMLVNSSGDAVALKVTVKNLFPVEDSAYPAKTWLVPQYDVVTVAPLSSARMDYIVNVPKDMPGKGYGGAILFQLYNPEDKTVSGSVFGTVITLNVLADGITTGARFTEFSVPLFQFASPAKLAFEINNPGNSNVLLSGKMILTGVSGKKIAESKIDSLGIFPQESKKFDFNMNSNGLLGIYKADVQLENSAQAENKISSSKWFVFVPWQKALLALLALGLIILAIIIWAVIYYKIKNKRQNQLAESSTD